MNLSEMLIASTNGPAKTTEEKIKNLLETCGPLSFGVICNRMRRTQQKEVASTLERLAATGEVQCRKETHKGNGKDVFVFFLDAANRAQALGKEEQDT